MGNVFLQAFIAIALLISSLSAHAEGAVSFASLATFRPAVISADLVKPDGNAPFPAVVLAHPCGGINAVVRNWARFFQGKGYVTLVVDSFTSRSIREVCTQGGVISTEDRAGDVLAALQYLQSLPFVDSSHVGLIGFSHGAMTVLSAVSEGRPFKLGASPDFAAAIAMYPDCLRSEVDTRVPLLIQSGEKDDWTAAAPCRMKATARKAEGYPVEMNIFKDAHHAFDNPTVRYYYGPTFRNPNKPDFCCGATMGYNPDAHQLAEKAATDFFREHLQSGKENLSTRWLDKQGPTKEDVVSLVQAAREYASVNGAQSLIDLINHQDSRFRKRRIFLVVLETSGKCLAHGRMPVAYTNSMRLASMPATNGRDYITTVRALLNEKPSWAELQWPGDSQRIYVEPLDQERLIVGTLIP